MSKVHIIHDELGKIVEVFEESVKAFETAGWRRHDGPVPEETPADASVSTDAPVADKAKAESETPPASTESQE